jgi:DNA-directed RNA polymerase specialized sigma24 family protein
VYTIANGKAMDYWRAAAPAVRLVFYDSVRTAMTERGVDYQQDHILAVQQALARLAPDDRFVLWLHDAEGATLEEIGRRIGRKRSAVAERLAHARERFRVAFGRDTGRSSSKLRLKE